MPQRQPIGRIPYNLQVESNGCRAGASMTAARHHAVRSPTHRQRYESTHLIRRQRWEQVSERAVTQLRNSSGRACGPIDRKHRRIWGQIIQSLHQREGSRLNPCPRAAEDCTSAEERSSRQISTLILAMVSIVVSLQTLIRPDTPVSADIR